MSTISNEISEFIIFLEENFSDQEIESHLLIMDITDRITLVMVRSCIKTIISYLICDIRITEDEETPVLHQIKNELDRYKNDFAEPNPILAIDIITKIIDKRFND